MNTPRRSVALRPSLVTAQAAALCIAACASPLLAADDQPTNRVHDSASAGDSVGQPVAQPSAITTASDQNAVRSASEMPQASASLELWALSLLSSDFSNTSGDVSANFARAELNASFPLAGTKPSDSQVLVFTAGTQVSSYDFSSGALQPPSAPPVSSDQVWDTLYSLDLSLSYRAPIDDRWSYILGAGITSSFETGADFEDTLTYGGFAALNYAFSSELILGGGVFVSTRLEDDVRILPAPFVRYQATESLAISTSPGTGPTGPGISLFYTIDDRWTAGLSVGFRTVEARLDNDGSAPGGVARHTAVPVVASISWRATDMIELTALAGYSVGQTYELLSSTGITLSEEDVEGSPTFALLAKFSF